MGQPAGKKEPHEGRTKRRLRESQRVFERLFEFAPDAILVLDEDGLIMQVNAQAQTMFGYERQELLGETVDMLVPERFRKAHPGHRKAYHSDPRLRPMGAGLELLGKRKDGTEFAVDIMLSSVDTPEGRRVLSVVRDVTERKRFEETLQEKNRELQNANLAKDRFLASMSHELRTPLNAIIGFTGTLLMKLPGPLNADQSKQLSTIKSSANHLLSLINDLLDLAKIESGKVAITLEQVVFQSVVEDVRTTLRPLAEKKGLKLRIHVPSEALILKTDRRALSQILLNLANNAIKFTEKGEVDIELRGDHHNGHRLAEISVHDTGVGIKKEDQAKLFQAFTQMGNTGSRRYEGTGLGLHLSQKLAELLGGQIRFQSHYGKGSTFTLSLPER